MARLRCATLNPTGSQGEQPPAASARSESPDELEHQKGMARHEGNASNALFETLSDWELTLRHSDIEFDDPFDGMEP